MKGMEILNTVLYIFVYITKNPVAPEKNDSGRSKMAIFFGLEFSTPIYEIFQKCYKSRPTLHLSRNHKKEW